jgi:hypothetical protein
MLLHRQGERERTPGVGGVDQEACGLAVDAHGRVESHADQRRLVRRGRDERDRREARRAGPPRLEHRALALGLGVEHHDLGLDPAAVVRPREQSQHVPLGDGGKPRM